jgi:hypothetical protein
MDLGQASNIARLTRLAPWVVEAGLVGKARGDPGAIQIPKPAAAGFGDFRFESVGATPGTAMIPGRVPMESRVLVCLFSRFQMFQDGGINVARGIPSEDTVDVTVTGNHRTVVQRGAILLAQEILRDLRALREKAGVLGTVDETDGNGEPL